MNQSASHELGEREAEFLARQFNTAFTTSSSYGNDHPMTRKAADALLEGLVKHLQQQASITVMLDRGALFIEKFAVGQRFNPRRLINLLSRMQIESITFGADVQAEEIAVLMEVLSDPDQFPNAAAARDRLAQAGIENVQLNYIVFRKVTADQKVVASTSDDHPEAASPPPPMPKGSASREDTFGSLASLMSLNELVRNPDDYAGRVSEQNRDDHRRQQLVRQLRNLIGQVESGQVSADSAMSSEDVLTAVNNLRAKVKRSYDSRKDVELILSEEDQVLGEIDQLTYSTLVSLVREEYRSGVFSVGRMAQIINRMLPDARDLKRLLPQLKQSLLAEGMTPLEYGKLVHQLSTELRGEHLVKALEQGADSVGLDVDEIVDQIRDDPAEAARLIVMATELRRSGATDEQQLSAAFTDYIERVSEQLIESSGGDRASAAVGDQLSRVQQLLVDQLNRQGLPPELISELQETLAAKKQQPGPESADHDHEPATLQSLSLPSRVLNPANTAFFLKREIKSAQRYKTPFTVIKVSIELLREPNGKVRTPEGTELARLLPEVYELIINQMRDLDLIGSLDKARRAVPVLILPMTESEGAKIVFQRLQRLLSTRPFRLQSEPLQLLCAVTSLARDIDDKESGDEFFRRLQKKHEVSRQDLLKTHSLADANA